jgi:Phosphotransferase enzyme family
MYAPGALPVDPRLPQLPTALDEAAMAEVFAGIVQAQRPGHRVEACALDRIKYRPGRNLAVSYRLRLREAGSAASFEQIVAARFCAAGESASRNAKAHSLPALRSAAGLVTSHVEALEMIAAWWPNDPKLGAAAELFGNDAGVQRRVLGDVVHAMTGGRGELVQHELHLAQVVPENRACARVELTYRGATGEAPQQRRLYVKADAERHGPITHAVMQALHGSAAQAQGRLLTPASVLWHAPSGSHWQLALPGSTLLDVAPQVSRAASMRVGALLAALHATPVPAERRNDASQWRERLRMVADVLACVEPRWEPLVRELASSLALGVDAAWGAPSVTLHGDLHPRNVLVAGERFGLIDLDSVQLGPAIADLGDWIADALYRALLGGQSVATALAACHAFLRAYAGASGAHCSHAALAWSTAHSLLCQRAWRSVVNLKPGRYALVAPLLEMAAAILRAGSIAAALDLPQRLAA